jgi:hypothetical protein
MESDVEAPARVDDEIVFRPRRRADDDLRDEARPTHSGRDPLEHRSAGDFFQHLAGKPRARHAGLDDGDGVHALRSSWKLSTVVSASVSTVLPL